MTPSLPSIPIVLVAFGTTQGAGRQACARFEQRLRDRFPGHDVHWAFTSSFVRRQLGLESPAELFRRLAADGCQRLVVQSLHLVPGEQHALGAEAIPPGLDVIHGAPLMATEADLHAVADRLSALARAGAANVVVVHGNGKHPEFNRQNLRLAELLAPHRPRLVLASLEGEPGDAPLAEAKVHAATAGAVHFLPLLLTPGRHVAHDIMGDHPAAWRVRLGCDGTTCGPTVAEDGPLSDLFLDHLAAALVLT